MSLRAELVRLGVRWFIKRRDRPGASVAQSRQWRAAAERLIPNPPAGTETIVLDAGGVPAVLVASRVSRRDRHILYLHGGGFVTGSSSLYRHLTWRLAAAGRARLLSVDYRLAPEHPFPAALEDAVAAYRWLLADGADSRRIAVMGDSAGGNLVFAMLLKARDEGISLPAVAVGLSPWLDLALESPSFRLNAEADPILNADEAPSLVEYYLAGADPRMPYASPVYGDPARLPPTLLQVGSDEILRDDSVRMAEKLRAAGCQVELEIWPRMPHVWHLFAPVMPEARQAIERIGTFLHARL
jgi:monoterpene epsilon-lactone hydrolase